MNYTVSTCVNGYLLEATNHNRMVYSSAESLCSSLLRILQLQESAENLKGGIPGFVIEDSSGKSIKMTPVQISEFPSVEDATDFLSHLLGDFSPETGI